MPKHSRRAATVSAAVVIAGLLAAVPAAAVPGPAANLGFAAKLTADGRACSGALVEPTLVLTAASCFPDDPAVKPVGVTVGGHTAKVTALIKRTDRDVALARIDTTITDVAPVKLGNEGAPGASEALTLAGWGRTDTEWVPNEAHTASFTAATSTATTLALTGTADACKGDAGAPVYRADGTVVAVAGASWQHGCFGETGTRQGTTGARVDDLGGWIRNQAIVGTAKAVGHGVTLSWTPEAGGGPYTIYASSSVAPVPAAELRVGETSATTFVHSAAAKKTWSYLIVSASGANSAVFSATTGARSLTDFTGDGKADLATFTRGTTGDVFVASSDGTKFNGTSAQWHERFSVNGEIPLSGDFDGDGKADVATFARGSTGDVYVALSDGAKFNGNGVLWQDYFAPNGEVPLVGDFNGDGKDDIATFTLSTSGDVYVALSDGTKFGAGALWHGDFGYGAELPAVGDFNGDGKDDIAVFTRGSTADVYVALSDGSRFVGSGVKWHDSFAWNNEIPAVGDFDGDGKDDIATFTRGAASDVFVSLSDGTKFVGNSVKWHDSFAADGEIPAVGDFTGDGKADIATFTRGTAGDVYVAVSDGTKFVGNGIKWHNNFAFDDEVPLPRAITIL